MRKTIIFALSLIIALSPIFASPAEKEMVVVFNCPTDDEGTPSHSEVVASVITQLRSRDPFDAFAFSADHPSVSRAIMENRLSRDMVRNPCDAENASSIASSLGGEYAMFVRGRVSGGKVEVSLELMEANDSQKRFNSYSESDIAEIGNSSVNRTNAVSTAVSSALSKIYIDLLGQDALLEDIIQPVETPTQRQERTIAQPREIVAETRDIDKEYDESMEKAKEFRAAEDLANATVEYRKAINLKPDNYEPRVNRAEIYADLGLTAQAIDECNRALMFDENSLEVYNLLTKIYLSIGSLDQAAAQCRKIINLDPRNVEAHILLGDISWNQANVEEATKAYEEAVNLDPHNALAHERLHRLYAARKMYMPALEYLYAARTFSLSDDLGEEERYDIVAEILRNEFNVVLGKLDNAYSDFQSGAISREDYYKDAVDATNRIEALANFLSTQTAPENLRAIHLHGALGANLLAQAGGYLVSYLETDRIQNMEQAVLLRDEAQTEIRLFIEGYRRGG